MLRGRDPGKPGPEDWEQSQLAPDVFFCVVIPFFNLQAFSRLTLFCCLNLIVPGWQHFVGIASLGEELQQERDSKSKALSLGESSHHPQGAERQYGATERN